MNDRPREQRSLRDGGRIVDLAALMAVAVVLGAALSACGSDETVESDGARPADVATAEAPSLVPGMTWQWQLQGEVDTSHDVDVYDIDLFDVPDETITALHGDGRIVVCYFSTAYEDWRPDVAAWPAEALGEPLDDWDGERWVDIRSEEVRDILLARLDLAVERSCDGVEPDNVTAADNETGFDLTADDQLDLNRFLADAAHERGLLIGLKNDLEQIPDLVDAFDFAVNEQCVEYDECAAYRPFVDAGKPVFGAEYSGAALTDPDEVCAVASSAGLSTLILSEELDGSVRIPC